MRTPKQVHKARQAKQTGRARQVAQRESSTKLGDAVLDVTVVLLEAGYASTAIGPIEVFHSAGVLWNMLHGETLSNHVSACASPRLTAPAVTSLCSLGLKPECAIE